MVQKYEDVINTTVKILKEMSDAAMKGFCEEIIRIQSYMIESQSAAISAGWVGEDGEHVIKNLETACKAVHDMTAAMITVAKNAGNLQVDGDQLKIDGYKLNEVSPDTN